MRSALRITLAILVGFIGIWLAPRANAACHSFTVKTDSPVTEGEKVKVTVSRDNNLDSSSVQVQTGNRTALAGADYDSTITRVEFTNETSRTIEIATHEDNVSEGTETFEVKLNSARGCRTFNTNYQYGPPATVTIKDDDGAATATPAPTAKPTAEATASSEATSTPEETASASPSGTPTAEPTESPEASAIALPTPEADDDDGLSPWLVAAAVGALVIAAGGALIATRMRRGGREI
jgi:hypothetical protein